MAQVVIGVRGGPSSKSRCAEALAPGARARLCEAMLEDMTDAVRRTPGVRQLWVVTPTPALAALASARSAKVIVQRGERGLNAAFALALGAVADEAPYEPVALMPGDLPLLQPDDLEAALTLARTHDVVLAPALADDGTGLVAMRAGVRLPLSFGPASFARHLADTEALGLSRAVVRATSLGLDLDRPSDFEAVLELAPASRTAALLRSELRQPLQP